MIENSLVEQTLGIALANGGDFAELFAEDVERSSVNLDDGRIELASDNEAAGTDSRTWGPVRAEAIEGVVTLLLDHPGAGTPPPGPETDR